MSTFELLETFGKWMGRFWLNRYVLALLALNTVTAAGVYAFLRYVLEINNSFWLAAVTGLTFPTILRSNFTFYRAVKGRKEEAESKGLSLRVYDWYRVLQNLCYQEANGQIADARAQLVLKVRRRLSEYEMVVALSAHITAGLLDETRAKQFGKLKSIQSLKDVHERLLRLAAFIVEVLPPKRIRALIRGRG